jgi:hypothetical protein
LNNYFEVPFESPLPSVPPELFDYGFKALAIGGFTPALRVILDIKKPNTTNFVGLYYNYVFDDFSATSSSTEGDFEVQVVDYQRKGSRSFPLITNIEDTYYRITPRLWEVIIARFLLPRDREHTHTLLFEYWCAYTFLKTVCSIPSVPPLTHELSSWVTLLKAHRISLVNDEEKALVKMIDAYNTFRAESKNK